MRHTFVVEITFVTGDIDPQDLMGAVEEVVDLEASAWEDIADVCGGTGLGIVHVECIDAKEAD